MLRVQVVRGLDDPNVEEAINRGEMDRQTVRPGHGITGKVFAERTLYVANEDEQAAMQSRSIVCLPLLIGDECIGVLNL